MCARHFSDGVGWHICQRLLARFRPQRHLERRPFSLAADLFFNDPAIGIPTQWLTGGTPDEVRYTSLDTPEIVDRRSLIDLTVAAASTLYTIASLDTQSLPQTALWNYQLAQESIQSEIAQYMERIDSTQSTTELKEIKQDAAQRLSLRMQAEGQTLRTLETLEENIAVKPEWDCVHELYGALEDAVESALNLIRSHLDARAEQLGASPEWDELERPAPADERVPLPDGTSLCTITLDSIPYENWGSPVKTAPYSNLPFILSWWLVDGQRTVGEIEQLTRLDIERYRECIPAWFTFLEKHGFVEFEGAEEDDTDIESESLAAYVTRPKAKKRLRAKSRAFLSCKRVPRLKTARGKRFLKTKCTVNLKGIGGGKKCKFLGRKRG